MKCDVLRQRMNLFLRSFFYFCLRMTCCLVSIYSNVKMSPDMSSCFCLFQFSNVTCTVICKTNIYINNTRILH